MQVVKEKKIADGIAKNIFKCEKAEVCGGATKRCYQNPERYLGFGRSSNLVCIPRRRWMYCSQWKEMLGMEFDKDLGIWIMPEWKSILMARVEFRRKQAQLKEQIHNMCEKHAKRRRNNDRRQD